MSSWRDFPVKNGVVVVAVGAALSGAGLRLHAQDKKPEPKKTEAAAQAQAEEVQNLVRLADAAMTGQQVPSDFPIQFQNDFLKAQNSRVWVPITLTIDPAKLTTGALTLYLRVAPRGMTAPAAPTPAAEGKDAKKNDKDKNKKDKDKDAKPASAGPSYP